MSSILVTNGYPSNENLYKNGFIHTRVKGYLKKGLDVKVIVFNDKVNNTYDYKFEGVRVSVTNKEGLIEILENDLYDSILVHFAFKKFTRLIVRYKTPYSKLIIWVHGVEALSWKRRIFNIEPTIKSMLLLLRNIFLTKFQLIFLKNIIMNQDIYNLHFVFVSNWMKEMTEVDTKTVNKIKNYSIIPNAIDTDLFTYKEKGASDRFNVLSIRPFHSRKYANDVTRDVILELSKKSYFNDFKFTIIGKGKLFKKITEPIKRFDNVEIINSFLTHNEIKKQHDRHGVLLIPTRQDAQGVSMCEGISSGLVAITTDNTAIPEFANSSYAYLASELHDYISAFDEIYANPEAFLNKSMNTVQLSKRLDSNIILNQEIKLITEK